MGMQESWLCLGYDTAGTARAMLAIPCMLPPPVLHLSRARYNSISWSKFATRVNFTAYPWSMKRKILHDPAQEVCEGSTCIKYQHWRTSRSTRSRTCARMLTAFTHSYYLTHLFISLICTILVRLSSCKKDAVYLRHVILHWKSERKWTQGPVGVHSSTQ